MLDANLQLRSLLRPPHLPSKHQDNPNSQLDIGRDKKTHLDIGLNTKYHISILVENQKNTTRDWSRKQKTHLDIGRENKQTYLDIGQNIF